MRWLSQHSAAIQAFSALAIALLTLALVLITNRYVKWTRATVDIMERDSAIRLQPRLVPSINRYWDKDVARGSFRIQNPGPNDAVLRSVELRFYCRRAEYCHHLPIEYPLLVYRVIPPNQAVEQNFEVSPRDACFDHEPHEGECDWIFRVEATCADLLGLRVHAFHYDEALGIHHYIESKFVAPGWLRGKSMKLQNTLRSYWYRARTRWRQIFRKAP